MSDSDDQSTMKKCVLCGQTGHTSAECKNGKVGSFKLFGVKIDPTADVYQSKDVECIQVSTSNREAKSMDELKIHNNIEDNSCIDVIDEHDNDRKKGIPWTEDEHRLFLDGLEKLGKGQWRSISKHYVPTRTPTQVASHAQKYFIRMSSLEEKRKRRSSLFDMQSMTLSLRPPAPPPLPMARTYGVECYNRLPDVVKRTSQMDHQNNRIPMVNCLFQENVHPLDGRAENFAASVSKEPLPLTNEEKWSTQEPQDEKPKD